MYRKEFITFLQILSFTIFSSSNQGIVFDVNLKEFSYLYPNRITYFGSPNDSIKPSGWLWIMGVQDQFRLGGLRSTARIFSPLLARISSGFARHDFLPEYGYLENSRGAAAPHPQPPPPPPHTPMLWMITNLQTNDYNINWNVDNFAAIWRELNLRTKTTLMQCHLIRFYLNKTKYITALNLPLGNYIDIKTRVHFYWGIRMWLLSCTRNPYAFGNIIRSNSCGCEKEI